MRLLLDTHVLLWFLAGDERLTLPARRAVMDPAHDVACSMASLWEIGIKHRRGRLPFPPGLVARGAEAAGFSWLGITPAHIETLATLPDHPDHRDPFDHLLIAQAIVEGATLVTADRFARRYAARVMEVE